jgi:pectin methylesterase-like acyl-CoA thioesterase
MSTHTPIVPKYSFHKHFMAAVILLAMSLSPGLFANTIIWSGANFATDTNWSDGANWVGGVAPGTADDVKFFNTGAASANGITNSIVDTGFGGTIGTLQFGSTNGFHTLYIAPGETLMVTNTAGLYVGTTADLGVSHTNYTTFTGTGGTLNITNSSATISLNQGTAQSDNFCQSILNLTNLGNFSATVSRIGIGTTTTVNPANANQREAGSLYLAMTNNITVTYSVPLNTYETLGTATNGIELQKNPGNNAGSTTPSTLFLGLTNTINVDSIGVGRDKSDASCLGRIVFNPVFIGNNPVAYFYGMNGPGSRVTWWAIGDGGNSASSSHGGYATNDFTGGTINAFVNVMSLGRDCAPQQTWSGPNKGVLTFTAGTIDVNTLLVGNQALGSSGSTTPNTGIVYVNGMAATLKVNTSLVLGNTTLNSAAAQNTSGALQINGGTVLANQISVGSFGTIANTLTVTNGTLSVSNTVASPSRSLTTLSLSGSTLQLNVLANTTNVFAAGFSTAGANTINIGAVPIFASYPVVVQLIKYTGTIGGAGYAGLTLGSIPANAPGAFLSNDVANAAVDLVLPNNPVPVITFEPLPFSGSPGSTVNLSVTNTGNTPLSYQWYYASAVATNALVDGPGESGSSTLTGSLTSALTIGNAQDGDSGSYFVVITNIYGAATSSLAPVTISANPILPSISRLNNQTNIAGTTASISPAVTGNPFPTLQWQLNGVNLTDGPGGNGEVFSGSATTTLSITNLQYPADQGTYSLIASNTAGAVTNSMILTVFVAPGITNQPVSVVVTNTQAASFTVLAGGVPLPTYQWYQNNNPISLSANATANSPTLSFASTSPTNAGTYYVQVANAAGPVNSASVTLTVNSTMSATALSPTNGATGICYDTPFYVTFSSPVVMNKTGKIRIYDTTNSSTPVDTIDLSQTVANGTQPRNLFPGDSSGFNYYPVVINSNNNVVAIYPQAASGIMTSNQTYYVTIDDGAFSDTNGAFFTGITATNTWQFATKTGGPANPTNLVVAQNNSADFDTVQGALDSIPSNNVNYTVINIRNGTYFEIVNTVTKNDVTFRGQSRTGSIVGYPNNANIAPGGSTQSRMAFKVNSLNIAIENMTVTNMTPQGGSQAEALMINTAASRFILNNAEVDSRQDTILANVNSSQGYFYNSLITGNFDYIWGGGNLFFTNCEIRTITGTSSQNLAAPRTDNGPTGNWPGYNGLLVSNGFSFVYCMLTHSASTVTNCSMSDANGQLNGNAVWSFCSMDTNCFTNAVSGALTTQLLWEYGCSNLNDTVALNNSATPFLGFTQLNNGDPREQAAASATNWLNGWSPALAVNIISQPVNQSVEGGQTASFTVGATGIPDPGYQWLDNGVPIPNANSATYNIPAVQSTNAGSYSVIVSNGSGSVTSQVATLTYILPVANPVSYTRYAGFPLGINITNLLSNVVDANSNLTTLVGTGVSTNGVTLGTSSGFLLYQNPNNLNDQFTYTASDGFGGTNTGLVSIVLSTNSVFGPVGPVVHVASGIPTVTYTGIAGLSYSINRSTNLLSGWTTIWTTNMPAGGVFQFTDPNPPQPTAFYQLLWNWY